MPTTTEPGTVLFDRYRVVRRIAAGGMGTVFEARDLVLDQPVALKRVSYAALPDDLADETRERTLREARNAAQLRGDPHVVAIYDVQVSDDDVWLVLEYLPSHSLAELTAGRTKLDVRTVASIGAPVARGLAAAHGRGITHRDVKPGNILIATTGEAAKLTDFGISHAEGESTLTATGQVSGTPAYMAREVARGEDATPASDVFSLGATLYAAVEGIGPFGPQSNPRAMVYRVANDPVRPPEVAGALASILMAMMADEPSGRPDATTVAGWLESVATQVEDAPAQGMAAGYDVPAPGSALPGQQGAGRHTSGQPGAGQGGSGQPGSGQPGSGRPGVEQQGAAWPGPGQQGSAHRAWVPAGSGTPEGGRASGPVTPHPGAVVPVPPEHPARAGGHAPSPVSDRSAGPFALSEPDRPGQQEPPRGDRVGRSAAPGSDRDGWSAALGSDRDRRSASPGPDRDGQSVAPGSGRSGPPGVPGRDRAGHFGPLGLDPAGPSAPPGVDRNGQPRSPARVPARPAEPGRDGGPPDSGVAGATGPSRRRRTPLLVGGVVAAVLLVLLGVVGVRALTATDEPAPVAASPRAISGDPRTADPCPLLDPAALQRFGGVNRVAAGPPSGCRVDITASDGKPAQLTASFNRGVTVDGGTQQAGDLTLQRGRTEDGEGSRSCTHSVVLPDGNQVLLQAFSFTSGIPPCDLADQGLDSAVAALQRDGVRYDPNRNQGVVLARADACQGLDAPALGRAGIGAAAFPGFASWSCSWGSSDNYASVSFAGTTARTGVAGTPGPPITGRKSWVDGRPGTCSVVVAHREGPGQDDLMETVTTTVRIAGADRDRACATATDLATTAETRLPSE